MLVEFLGKRSKHAGQDHERQEARYRDSFYAVPGLDPFPVGGDCRRPTSLVHRADALREDRLPKAPPEDLPPEAEKGGPYCAALASSKRGHSTRAGGSVLGRNNLLPSLA